MSAPLSASVNETTEAYPTGPCLRVSRRLVKDRRNAGGNLGTVGGRGNPDSPPSRRGLGVSYQHFTVIPYPSSGKRGRSRTSHRGQTRDEGANRRPQSRQGTRPSSRRPADPGRKPPIWKIRSSKTSPTSVGRPMTMRMGTPISTITAQLVRIKIVHRFPRRWLGKGDPGKLPKNGLISPDLSIPLMPSHVQQSGPDRADRLKAFRFTVF